MTNKNAGVCHLHLNIDLLHASVLRYNILSIGQALCHIICGTSKRKLGLYENKNSIKT